MPADIPDQPEDTNEDAHSDGQGEEAPDVPRLRDPGEPTQSEIDLHAQTGHANYRSWCPHCVRGRARDGSHRPTRRAADAIPTISFDYCFFTEGAGAEAEGSPILVMHDDISKSVFAHAVPQKGIQYPLIDLVVQAVARDINSLGYRRIIIKDDQEESILAFAKAVKRVLARDVVFEQSPVGDPQSNGAAERAVQIVKGMIRTVRDACETSLGEKIPIDSPVMTWIVAYATAVQRRFAIGLDGRSSYQRNKGKVPTSMVAEFGEKIWYRPLHPGTAGRRPAAEPRFELGCFLLLPRPATRCWW